MFKPPNVKSTLKPITTLCPLFGLLHTDLSKSPVKLYLNIHPFLLLTSCVTLFVILDETSVIPDVNVIIQIADIWVQYSNQVLFITSVIFTHANRKIICHAMRDLVRMERTFSNDLQRQVNLKRLKWFVWGHVIFWFGFWLFVTFYYVNVICRTNMLYCAGYYYSHYTSGIVSHLLAIQFTSIILLIKSYYTDLNEKLTETHLYRQNTLDYLFKNIHTKIVTIQPSSDERKTNDLPNMLLTMREIHGRLLTIVKTVNYAFSIPLFCLFLNTFIVIFCMLYNSLFGYVLQGTPTPKGVNVFVILPVCMLIVAAVKAFTIAFVSDVTVKESRRTGVILYRVGLLSQDERVKQSIFDFSQQILHNVYTISAYDFFDVNCELIQAIIGAVTRYLIILIQFDLDLDKNGQKHG